MTELQPCAMFANGPPWTRAGVPSSVCTRLGWMASRRSAAIAPVTLRSRASTGRPSKVKPRSICPQARLEIPQVLGQAQERHHLGRGGDEEPLLARVSLEPPAEAEHDLAESPVVHVHGPAEQDLPRVDAERVVVVEVVVEARGQEVVGALHRVDVAREVKVDRVGRHDLRAPPACPASLDAEARPDRRLPQCHDGPPTDPPEGLPESDRDRRLPVTRRRRRDGGHDHQLS